MPLMTAKPVWLSSSAKRWACSRPYIDAWREPTIAIERGVLAFELAHHVEADGWVRDLPQGGGIAGVFAAEDSHAELLSQVDLLLPGIRAGGGVDGVGDLRADAIHLLQVRGRRRQGCLHAAEGLHQPIEEDGADAVRHAQLQVLLGDLATGV